MFRAFNNNCGRLLFSSATLVRPTTHRLFAMNLMTISQSLNDSYKKHKIYPDIVDEFKPKGLLTVEYETDNQVALGNTLKVKDTQKVPVIQFTVSSPNNEVVDIKSDDKFTLILTDPDAPTAGDKKWSEYCHWILTDLKLNSTESANSIEGLSTILDYSTGKELVSYMGPAPPPKTKKHRYIFLLYKQDPSFSSFQPLSDRPNWGTGVPGSGVRDWIKKYGKMELFGVNFYYAQNEVQE